MACRLLLLTCLTALATSAFGTECQHRDYGHGSTVCVCKTTLCDNFPALSKTDKGVVKAYSSSKDGDRFHVSQLNFTAQPNKHKTVFTVELNRSHQLQKIVGFGGAFTDSSGYNIVKLPKQLQIRLIKDYFGSDGIEYTMGRIPMGGSDFSTRGYSYDDHPGDESLSKFALQKEDFEYKIPFLKMAQEVSPHNLKFFGSPWSAPAWMKTNDNLIHGGFIKGKPGEKYYKIYAKYFIKFLEKYHKNQIQMWGLTIENEPGAGFSPNYKWNSLGFNGTLERDFIKMDLGPELYHHNYTSDKLKLMIYDDQLPNVKKFSEHVLTDSEAAKFVSGIAFHWYDNKNGNKNDLDYLVQKYPDRFILATEACEEWKGHKEHVMLGSWDTFNRYATDIIEDLNHHTSGWIDWNLVLDLQGGPNWVGNYVDAPIIVNATGQEYYKQPIFYAMGHFSKFLVQDSVRLQHITHNQDTQHVQITVFQRPDSGTVMIVLNKNNHAIELNLHDPTNGYVDVPVKANSMQTLIWY